MDVWVTDNSSTKRRGQYIAYAATRAADGPDGMEARGRPFSVGGKGLRARAAGKRVLYLFVSGTERRRTRTHKNRHQKRQTRHSERPEAENSRVEQGFLSA